MSQSAHPRFPRRLSCAVSAPPRHPYMVGAELRHGAMSMGHNRRDGRLERDVAVKVLRPEVGSAIGTALSLHEMGIPERGQDPSICSLLELSGAMVRCSP